MQKVKKVHMYMKKHHILCLLFSCIIIILIAYLLTSSTKEGFITKNEFIPYIKIKKIIYKITYGSNSYISGSVKHYRKKIRSFLRKNNIINN